MDLFSTLLGSFGSVAAYVRAVYFWRWKMLAYYMILSAVSAAVPYYVISMAFDEFCAKGLPALERQLEGVEIVDWRVRTPGGAEVLLKDSGGNAIGAATQGYVDASKTAGLLFALEKDRVSFYFKDSEIPMFLKDILPGKPNFPASDLLALAKESFRAVRLPLVMSLAMFYNLAYILILSFAVYILSQTKLPGLSWARSFKFSTVALTPAIFLDIFSLLALGVRVPSFVLALASMFVVYRVMSKMPPPPELRGGGDIA